jgi:hypothetical protein
VWSAILRWAYYLASTPDLVLTYRWEDAPGAAMMVASSNASLGNGTDGLSYGGYVIAFAGAPGFTGALSIKVIEPVQTGDSSGARPPGRRRISRTSRNRR